MKKTLLSIVTATTLFTSQANASGMAVFDASALSQQILGYVQQITDYTEQIKQVEELVKNTMNWEKQLEYLGIDMNEINQILGSAMEAVNSVENLYETITNVPDNIKKQWDEVNKACDFLQQNSSGFSSQLDGLSEIKSILGDSKSKLDKCLKASQNPKGLMETLKELRQKINSATTSQEKEEIQAQITSLENAKKVLDQELVTASAQDAFNDYEKFFNEIDGKQSQIQKNSEDIKKFTEQLKKGNLNEKQQAALQNSLLLKILENMHQSNQIAITQQKLIAQIAQQNNKENATEKSYKNVEVTQIEAPKDEPAANIKLNRYGLPAWGE